MQIVSNPIPVFTALDGTPLEAAKLYFGVVGQNPETNPTTVYWDSALTQPAAQPIRTIGGMPSRNGTPANLYTESLYSISVRNRAGVLVYNSPDSSSSSGGALANTDDVSKGDAQVGFKQPFSNASASTVHEKLSRHVDVKDFGAKGDGTTDDTLPFSYAIAALSSGGILHVPPGRYKVTSALTIGKSIRIVGSAPNSSVIVPAGNFDLFTFNGGTMGAGIKDLSVSAAGMTGGNCVAVNTADRTSFENLIITDPFNGFDIRKANVCSIHQVWMNAVRGNYGIQWFGDASNRSDVLDLDNVVMSCSSNTVGAVGVLVDGNVNTLDMRHVACTTMGRGLWVKNSSGGPNPAFVTAYDFQCDFTYSEAVRLEGSARSVFLTDLYAHGSATTDGVFIDPTVQNVHIQGAQIDSCHSRGIFAGGRYIRIASCQISNNSAEGSNVWPGVEIGGSSIGVNIVGSLLGQWVGYAANNQSYGVLVNAGAQAYMVTGCNLRLNVSGDYLDNASDGASVIFGNNTASSTHALIGSPVRAISGDLLLYGSGGNSVKLGNATNGTAFAAQASAANSVNYPKAFGVAAGSAPSLEAVGSDTNIDLRVAAKGNGVLQVGNAGSFAANGSVGTTMTSVGPTGARTTVQKWLTIKDPSGNPFYIPCY